MDDRVWPILIVGRNMHNNGWRDFCREHNLRISCHVVLSCKRRCVFNTFIFNENGQEITYPWTNPYPPLQKLHDTPGIILDNLYNPIILCLVPILLNIHLSLPLHRWPQHSMPSIIHWNSCITIKIHMRIYNKNCTLSGSYSFSSYYLQHYLLQ